MTLPPILHAGGFSWDEALVLAIAIAIVPVLSWVMSRLGKRRAAEPTGERRARRPVATTDDASSPDQPS